jgi:hypothetical protein
MSAEYTQYIVEHKANVEKAYKWLIDHNIFENCELPVNIVEHDLSKYGADEYQAYDNYFYGKKTKEAERAFNYAWLHHIHHNPHHWQHWLLKEDDDELKALEMPEEYVYEMIADWWAFSWNKNDLTEIFTWYKDHKPKMILHPDTKTLVESILNKMKNELKNLKAERYSLLEVE